MKVKTEDFISQCGHRSVEECSRALCGFGAELKALDVLIKRFADAMKERLCEKYLEGWHGWDEEDFDVEKIRERIYRNLFGTEEGGSPTDVIDIANLAAFWWNKLGEEVR